MHTLALSFNDGIVGATGEFMPVENRNSNPDSMYRIQPFSPALPRFFPSPERFEGAVGAGVSYSV